MITITRYNAISYEDHKLFHDRLRDRCLEPLYAEHFVRLDDVLKDKESELYHFRAGVTLLTNKEFFSNAATIIGDVTKIERIVDLLHTITEIELIQTDVKPVPQLSSHLINEQLH